MNSLTLGMIHTCNVLSISQDQKLEFSNGSVAFTVGALLTGADSAATGTIKEIFLESGSWAVSTATGHLILSNVSGTFQAGEYIHDEHGGASSASGPAEPVTDGVGTPQLTTTSRHCPSCRFSQANQSGGTIQSQDSGDYIVAEPLLFLPVEAVIQEGDFVSSNVPGYTGPYKVMHVGAEYGI